MIRQVFFINLVFKAISDPNRRKILKLLREKDMTAGEIADHFAISKPSISHHLSMLKQSGLVQDERKGQYIIYSLNSTVFQELMSWVYDLMEVNESEGKKSEK